MVEVQAVQGGKETLRSTMEITTGYKQGIVLAITIDKDGSVTADLCATVSPDLAKQILQEALDSIPDVKGVE